MGYDAIKFVLNSASLFPLHMDIHHSHYIPHSSPFCLSDSIISDPTFNSLHHICPDSFLPIPHTSFFFFPTCLYPIILSPYRIPFPSFSTVSHSLFILSHTVCLNIYTFCLKASFFLGHFTFHTASYHFLSSLLLHSSLSYLDLVQFLLPSYHSSAASTAHP
uniref:Uncharacterized protein n=1 Tax=Sphaerodactylus townsendi TaxID=933632 RepID=A0ACB8EJD3_9SAUR